MKLVIAFALTVLSVALAQNEEYNEEYPGIQGSLGNHVQGEHYLAHHPKFHFSYAVSDPKTHDVKQHWEDRDGKRVRGEYRLLQPDGLVRIVAYGSDGKSGMKYQVKYVKHSEVQQSVEQQDIQQQYNQQQEQYPNQYYEQQYNQEQQQGQDHSTKQYNEQQYNEQEGQSLNQFHEQQQGQSPVQFQEQHVLDTPYVQAGQGTVEGQIEYPAEGYEGRDYQEKYAQERQGDENVENTEDDKEDEPVNYNMKFDSKEKKAEEKEEKAEKKE